MISIPSLSGALVVVLAIAGCSTAQKLDASRADTGAAKAGKVDTSDMAGMAGMPGMATGSKDAGKAGDDTAKAGAGVLAPFVTLSAAQIEHGGVKWGSPTMGTASGSATIPGEIAPNEDRTARLGAPARGRILAVAVRPGDRVAKGQLLVTMQSPEAGMAQSDVAKADAELSARRAEAQYAASARARAERLLVLKAIPRQDYDRAIADDERAKAALTQADAEVRRAHATAGQLGTSANGEIALRAPSAGVVLARTAVPGAVVEAGAPLIVVSDPASLWLTINAPEPSTSLFHRGGTLRFTVPAYPADTFTARVDAIGASLEPETRTLSIRGIVMNGAGRLKPEMLANVLVQGVGSASAAFVPEDAVQLLQGKPHVFLAQPDAKGGARFARREVVLGSRSGGRVAVVRGLSAGDVVVIGGAFAVKAAFEKAAMPKMEM
jgi:cobalt-zinc-cadmium efflux system membrane fusion protein